MNSASTYMNIVEKLNKASSMIDSKEDKASKKVLDACIKAPVKIKDNLEEINALLNKLKLEQISSPNLVLVSIIGSDLLTHLESEMGKKVKPLKSKKDNEIVLSLTKIASSNGVDPKFYKKHGLKVSIKIEDKKDVIQVNIKAKGQKADYVVIDADAKKAASAYSTIFEVVRMVSLKALIELKMKSDMILVDELKKYEASGDLDCQMIPNLPDEAYHNGPGYSSSNIKRIFTECYAIYEQEQSQNRESSLERNEGKALHTLLLEPELFEDSYVEGLDLPKATKADKVKHKIFEMENFSKIILPTTNYNAVIRKADLLKQDERIQLILNNAMVEYSFFYNKNGILVKARPDIMCVVTEENYDFLSTVFHDIQLCDIVFFDLKYLRSIEPSFVNNEVGNKRYDMSAKHYIDTVKKVFGTLMMDNEQLSHLRVTNNFALICVAKGPVDLCEFRYFDSEEFSVSSEHLELGMSKIRSKNEYKGYSQDPTAISIPKYVHYKYNNS